jgi:hypothetical protein
MTAEEASWIGVRIVIELLDSLEPSSSCLCLRQITNTDSIQPSFDNEIIAGRCQATEQIYWWHGQLEVPLVFQRVTEGCVCVRGEPIHSGKVNFA